MLLKITTIAARVLCLAYFLVACITFPQARRFLSDKGKIDDGIYYMPLIICDFETVEQTGTTISFDTDSIEGCTTLDLLVNAAAASLIVSAVAVFVYLAADILLRYGKLQNSWVKKSTLMGFAIFLIFILIQAAISSWALAAQAKRFIDYTDALFTKLDYFEIYDIDEVKSHGNPNWLWTAGAASILAATGVFVDSLVTVLCPPAEGATGTSTDLDSNVKSLEMSSPSTMDTTGKINMTVGLPETQSSQPWATP